LPNGDAPVPDQRHLILKPFLERLTSRSILSEPEREQVLDLPGRIRQVRPNEELVADDERVDFACLVVEGLVGRFHQEPSGDRQITALHIRGDMPDLHSVVQPLPTSALQALSKATIVEVPHAALRRASSACPAIAEAFWRDCMVDSMIMARWLVNLGRRDAKSRIAHLLCEMACRYGAAPATSTIVFELPMTQLQLADATGLTSVHVNRTLKALREAGTAFHHQTVRIADWDKIAEIGDFDADYLQINVRPHELLRPAPRTPPDSGLGNPWRPC
jgi:CRP-like cAMP-binding protein